MSRPQHNRRDFLTGRAARARVAAAQDSPADAMTGDATPPAAGPTIRLAVRAMATEFGVLMNPGPAQVPHASDALDLVALIERHLTVYRDDSEVSRINATAADGPVVAEASLFDLLVRCAELTERTDGAFDVAVQAQIRLWSRCRAEHSVPTDAEIAAAAAASGMRRVRLDPDARSVAFDAPGVGLNLGAIGKGYALDRCADLLTGAIDAYCLHGGHSSVLARGGHAGADGWPVGIGNPLFTTRRLGTILLKDRALGTSGSNVQFYRHEGRRYGHILDPRTGRPAGELLSATVLAPTAAEADALSTAFFILGVEKARAICDNSPLIGALLIPPPDRGGRLEPVAVNLPPDVLFLDPEQATVG